MSSCLAPAITSNTCLLLLNKLIKREFFVKKNNNLYIIAAGSFLPLTSKSLFQFSFLVAGNLVLIYLFFFVKV
jgi:hypothetical protein